MSSTNAPKRPGSVRTQMPFMHRPEGAERLRDLRDVVNAEAELAGQVNV